MRPSSIAIVGLGKLGGNLAQEIIRCDGFRQLFLFNRSPAKLDSAALSLRVFGAFVGSRTEIISTANDLKEAEMVVITIKEDYDPRALLKEEVLPDKFDRNVRTIGIRKDLPILKDVCAKLKGYKGKVIVITNPVDIFTVLVKGWLPTADVYGLGVTVDSARLAFVAQRSGFKCTVSDCPLGGVHIGRIVQLRSLWNPASPLYNQTSWAIEDLLASASTIGPAIVQGLGFTLHDCAAVFSRDLAWFAGKDEARKHICVSIGDATSAVGRPLMYDEHTSSFTVYGALLESELRQLEDAAGLVCKAVEMVRRNAFFRWRSRL